MKEKTAIVILNWNGEKMLRQYLPSVIAHASGTATVYVADNASTDQSVKMLQSDFPEVRLILLDKNWGFAEGYNKALAQVDAEYFVLLNSDVETTPDWLQPIISFMDSHADVAACQPKIHSMFRRDEFEYAGAAGGFLDKYGYPFCRGRIFETVEKDRGQYDSPCEILWATGAAMVVRASDYRTEGGLDGRFFAHNEEIDLCWRMAIHGKRIFCLPASVVYHVGGGTLPKNNPNKTFLNFRNNLTMLYKCTPDGELSHVMRVRAILDYVAAAKMLLLDRNPGDFKAVLRARKAFRKWLPQFAEDRKKIQAARTADAIPGLKQYSLLWQYYAHGKRLFSQL